MEANSQTKRETAVAGITENSQSIHEKAMGRKS